MRKISKSTAVLATAVGCALGVGVTTASAAGTWTVSGGTSFTGSASSPTLTDSRSGAKLTCTSSAASGTAANGTGLSGTGIASLSSVSWTNCTGPAGITFTVTPQGLPWAFNAVSYSAPVTTGTLTGVKAHISGTLCSADFQGATAGSTATLNGSYNNTTHQLTISGGNLHAYNVVGCLGLIANNDAATYNGVYTVSPALTITSP
ncbi:hypothetical protein [Streptacidiphilus monticola]|uniref:Ig-like domain-containing protein n=1 Tax=Streptacidiphilus monticola TaxID=2161674 RepID=A0ABW1GA85_9ACTN